MSMFEELNVQGVLEADRGLEERVRDALVEDGKLPLVVHELITLEMWRQEVLPKILSLGQPKTVIQVNYDH